MTELTLWDLKSKGIWYGSEFLTVCTLEWSKVTRTGALGLSRWITAGWCPAGHFLILDLSFCNHNKESNSNYFDLWLICM